MKKIISYKFAVFFVLGISFSSAAGAQENEMIDTVELKTVIGDEVKESSDDYSDEQSAEADYPDTLASQLRPVPADTIKAISSDKGFYYKNYIDSLLRARQKIRKEAEEVVVKKDSFFQSFFELIIWVFAVGVLLFIIYKLFLTNSSLFSRSRRNTAGEVVREEEENLNDIDARIQKAIAEGKHRLAIRYLYLQTLRNLADRKLIEMGTEKTNYQYVNEVRKHSFANEFASLTLTYEYIWYGEYPVDKLLFEQIRSSFKNFSRNTGR